MKRRDFIKSSFLALGGTTLMTTGCSSKRLHKAKEQVARRKFKDITVPLLGLGCLRLPMNGKKIDMVELEKMVDYAITHGVNYFDTAYFYVNGKSENAIGEVLKNYHRKDFLLADKTPPQSMKSKEDVRRVFEEQLKKCQVGYFDFYMIHSLKPNTIENYRKYEMFNQLMEFKKEEKIKYTGFSFHGSTKMLKEVVAEHPWDFCYLQINYFDWDIAEAHQQYDILKNAGIPTVVMEPLKGGNLVRLSDKALNKLKEKHPDTTPAEFALRWAASKENVITVLSGMSNLQQIKENINTFVNFKEMTDEEEKTAKQITSVIQAEGEINCTACKYCMEVCPRGINIPLIMSLYNQFVPKKWYSAFAYRYKMLDEDEKADKCIKCGLCSKNCPQNLLIPELLTKIDKLYQDIQSGKIK